MPIRRVPRRSPQYVVAVGGTHCDFVTIQAARDSITDAASNKIYTILVAPGRYNETVTLKNYVNIIAYDPDSVKILNTVTDNASECHCVLAFDIETSGSATGLISAHANSDITLHGNIIAGGIAASCQNGTLTIYGDIQGGTITAGSALAGGTLHLYGNLTMTAASSVALRAEGGTIILHEGDATASAYPGAFLMDNGILKINNGKVSSTYNNALGHGVYIVASSGTLIVRNEIITCLHADAKSVYAEAAQDVKIYSMYANRALDGNITNIITGALEVVDADVE